MYKDKEKQKQANKAANKRYRDKQKGITPQGDSEGITEQIPEISDTQRDTASQEPRQCTKSDKVIASYPGCFDPTLNRPRTASLPGNEDYNGCATPERIAASKRTPQPATAAPVDADKAEDNDPLGRIHSAEQVATQI